MDACQWLNLSSQWLKDFALGFSLHLQLTQLCVTLFKGGVIFKMGWHSVRIEVLFWLKEGLSGFSRLVECRMDKGFELRDSGQEFLVDFLELLDHFTISSIKFLNNNYSFLLSESNVWSFNVNLFSVFIYSISFSTMLSYVVYSFVPLIYCSFSLSIPLFTNRKYLL